MAKVLGLGLIIVSVLVAFWFAIDSEALIPTGYVLAINGYVVSRTLMIIFLLYIFVKIGLIIIEKRDD